MKSAAGARLWMLALLVRARFLLPIVAAAGLAAFGDGLVASCRRVFARGARPVAATVHNPLAYACPMHPHVVQEGPGHCPECGMPLVPRPVQGDRDRVTLTAAGRDLAGIRLVTVERRRIEKEIVAPASLEADERRIVKVTSPVKGYVERVVAPPAGARVHAGQLLLRMRAPDLAGSARELIREKQTANPQYPLARQRLILSGLTDRQIDRIERSGDPLHLEFDAPAGGVLVSRNASPGDMVMEGAALFGIADLSRIWLVARVREEDAALLEPGTAVSASLTASPAEPYSAVVESWEPLVDRETRTLGIRASLQNADGALRPGMTARATFLVPLSDRGRPPLVLPLAAIADDGLRQTVWRESGGSLRRIPVTVAGCARASCAVSGLEEGDRVVAEGAFLVSSEARTVSGLLAPPPSATGTHEPLPTSILSREGGRR